MLFTFCVLPLKLLDDSRNDTDTQRVLKIMPAGISWVVGDGYSLIWRLQTLNSIDFE